MMGPDVDPVRYLRTSPSRGAPPGAGVRRQGSAGALASTPIPLTDRRKKALVMTDEPTTLAASYFQAWKARDFATLRSVLADQATFRGPLGGADSADECVAGLEQMSQILADIVIHKVFADGPDVLTWFDLHTTIAPPAATANWSHIDNGKISAIRVTFDPRAIVAAR